MSFRLAAYAVCLDDAGTGGEAGPGRHAGGRVLLAHCASPAGWTLPGGRVEQGEDPIDTVIRELGEETGYDGVVEALLGVDSRVIPAAESYAGVDHQNIGIFYLVRVTGGIPRPEPNGAVTELAWTPLTEVPTRPRSGLVDVGLSLARTRPATGHVSPFPVGGRIQH